MEGSFDQQWAMPQTFGAGNALPPELLKWLAQQQPSASGWDGGGQTFGGYTVAPVSGIQTNSDGSITNPGPQGYVSENNALSQKENIANPDAMANLYGADGAYQSSFRPEDPYKQDPMELAILAAIAAGGAQFLGPLLSGAGGAGSSAAGLMGPLTEVQLGAGFAEAFAPYATGAASGVTSMMGPMTEAQLGESFAQQFGQYLSPSSAMGPMTQEQLGKAFQQQFAPYQVPGVPPPANPFTGNGGQSSMMDKAGSFLSNPKNLAGLATTALGAASGAGGAGGAGGSGGGSGFAQMDPRLDPYVFGSLLPNANATMQSAIPQAQLQAGQMATTGGGLLSQPMAGNGYGQVKLNAPTTATNPYISGVLDDLQRRSNDMIGKNLQGIRGNSVGVGGLGGSRQGVAEAQAISQGTDNFTGQAANFMGGMYNQDQNRALQQYGMDQSFWQGQRGQDYAGANLGMNMLNQSQNQLWQPMQAASDIYRPYTALPSASGGSDSKNNWQSIAGGLLSGASLAGKMGLWG